MLAIMGGMLGLVGYRSNRPKKRVPRVRSPIVGRLSIALLHFLGHHARMKRTQLLIGLVAGTLLGWLGGSMGSSWQQEESAVSDTDREPVVGIGHFVTEGKPDAGVPGEVPAAPDQQNMFAQEREEWRLREQTLMEELDLAYQHYENAVSTMMPRSAQDQLEALLAEGDPDQTLSLHPAGDGTGADAGGELTWFNTGNRGFLRVEGLSNLDPGHWTYQVWVTDGQRDQEAAVSCGTLNLVAGRANLLILDPMVLVQRPLRAWVTVERAGGAVQSMMDRVALASQ